LPLNECLRNAAYFLIKRDVREDVPRDDVCLVHEKCDAQAQRDKEDECNCGGKAADSRKHNREKNTPGSQIM